MVRSILQPVNDSFGEERNEPSSPACADYLEINADEAIQMARDKTRQVARIVEQSWGDPETSALVVGVIRTLGDTIDEGLQKLVGEETVPEGRSRVSPPAMPRRLRELP